MTSRPINEQRSALLAESVGKRPLLMVAALLILTSRLQGSS